MPKSMCFRNKRINYEDAKSSVSDKAEEPGEYVDDAAITGKIKMDILGDPMLKLFQISVTTTDGVVNLSGIVDSRHSIDRALEIARNVQAVTSVDNGPVVK
jgi:hyperosmotically inducible protein